MMNGKTGKDGNITTGFYKLEMLCFNSTSNRKCNHYGRSPLNKCLSNHYLPWSDPDDNTTDDNITGPYTDISWKYTQFQALMVVLFHQ